MVGISSVFEGEYFECSLCRLMSLHTFIMADLELQHLNFAKGTLTVWVLGKSRMSW